MRKRKIVLSVVAFLFVLCLVVPAFPAETCLVDGKWLSLEGPKTTFFVWRYKGVQYALEKIFYKSVRDYYRSKLDTSPYVEQVVLEILAELKNIAKDKKFTEDETLEFIVAFVQQIPYDYKKLDLLKRGVETGPPGSHFEVLYNNTGLCGEKSDLAALMIKSLGYGFAVLRYWPREYSKYILGHRTIAIKCPLKYASYIFIKDAKDDSVPVVAGYCFVEITCSTRMGVVPWAYLSDSLPVVSPFTPKEQQLVNDSLGNPLVSEIYDGKTYSGIVQIHEIAEKLGDMQVRLAEIKGRMAEMGPAEEMARKRKYYARKMRNSASPEKWKKKYEDALEKYNKYTKYANEYNEIKTEYEILLKQLYW